MLYFDLPGAWTAYSAEWTELMRQESLAAEQFTAEQLRAESIPGAHQEKGTAQCSYFLTCGMVVGLLLLITAILIDRPTSPSPTEMKVQSAIPAHHTGNWANLHALSYRP